jgi:hypothetical protein
MTLPLSSKLLVEQYAIEQVNIHNPDGTEFYFVVEDEVFSLVWEKHEWHPLWRPISHISLSDVLGKSITYINTGE